MIFSRRANPEGSLPLTAAALVDWLGNGLGVTSAVKVNEESSWKASAVYRGASVIAETAGALPMNGFAIGPEMKGIDHPFLETPCPGWTPMEFWSNVYQHMIGWGNFYGMKIYGPRGITGVVPMSSSDMAVGTHKNMITPENPTGKMFVRGPHGTGYENVDPDNIFTPREIFHVPAFGYDGICGVSPIRLMAQGIALSLSAELYSARQFTNGSLIAGILQTEQRINEVQAEELSLRWRQKATGIARAHDIVTLGSGAKFQPIQFPNTDMQMIENRKFQVEEVARFLGVPSHMLAMTEKSTSWGTGIEEQVLGFINFTLRNYTTRAEQRVTYEILPRGEKAQVSYREITRGNAAARAGYYNIMRMIGAMNVDEIRAEEGKPPLPDGLGQVYLQPLNMAPLGTEPEPTQQTQQPDPEELG